MLRAAVLWSCLGFAALNAASPVSPAASVDAPDPALQAAVDAIDLRLRSRWQIGDDRVAVALCDLATGRTALLHPDRIDYAASIPKIAILLAWFERHPEAAGSLDAVTRHELGLMIKVSDNAMATKYSQALGLDFIQATLARYHLYDTKTGGGLWMGKHYGKGGERRPDPVGGHSHAATARQVLRFYLMLERGQLVSPEASARMKEIFASPDIAHVRDKFALGLAGREREILRKAGWWEDWRHDSALIRGDGRNYVLVALTRHPQGEDYLVALAPAIDDLLAPPNPTPKIGN